jgi:hypothetical protein
LEKRSDTIFSRLLLMRALNGTVKKCFYGVYPHFSRVFLAVSVRLLSDDYMLHFIKYPQIRFKHKKAVAALPCHFLEYIVLTHLRN